MITAVGAFIIGVSKNTIILSRTPIPDGTKMTNSPDKVAATKMKIYSANTDMDKLSSRFPVSQKATPNNDQLVNSTPAAL